jgi:multidrug efflux system outer membrane protein
VDTLRREEDAQRAVARAGAEARRLSEIRYRSGADDHLRFLDAQRSDYANQMALMQVQTQRQLALADLFRALGGSWRSQSAMQGDLAAP